MNKTILVLVIGILTLVGFNTLKSQNATQTVSFGNFGGEAAYATTTDEFGAVVVGGSKLLKTGPGVLEHIVITNETAGSFNVYDATSTNTNHRNHATTTIAKISASLAEGSYDFQVAFARGLLIEFQSTNIASSTITWK